MDNGANSLDPIPLNRCCYGKCLKSFKACIGQTNITGHCVWHESIESPKNDVERQECLVFGSPDARSRTLLHARVPRCLVGKMVTAHGGCYRAGNCTGFPEV